MTTVTFLRRFGWFIALWMGGVAGVIAITLPLRWILKAAA
jgi:hypothetical protein